MKIKSVHVTPDNFKRFGKVVSFPQGEPTSMAADYKFWSDIAHYKINGNTEIGICTVYKQPKNEISGMERHMLTPEILIPIDGPFILPVLLEGRKEEMTEAFRVDVGEAVITNASVWHGACLPIDKNESSYFVIFRRNTPAEDVEKKNISPIEIEL
jgi:ureidoglycolate hydrolase